MRKSKKVRKSGFEYNKIRYIELVQEQAKAKGRFQYNDYELWGKWKEFLDYFVVLLNHFVCVK